MSLATFWCTTLAKVLAGDQPCYLSAWLSGRMKFPKRGDQGSLATWRANHTEQLRAAVDRFRGDGWTCKVEQFFRVPGQSAILSGKVDLILQQTDKRPRIVDVKSGIRRDSDVTQVLIEMVMIPLAWQSPSMIFDGEVVYQDGSVLIKSSDAEALKPKVFKMLKWLGTVERPSASPSESACRFCDVPESECHERWTEDRAPGVLTSEF